MGEPARAQQIPSLCSLLSCTIWGVPYDIGRNSGIDLDTKYFLVWVSGKDVTHDKNFLGYR